MAIHVHSQAVYLRLGLLEPGSTLPTTKVLDLVQVRVLNVWDFSMEN